MKYLNPLRLIRLLLNKYLIKDKMCINCGHHEKWHRIMGCVGYCLCNTHELNYWE